MKRKRKDRVDLPAKVLTSLRLDDVKELVFSVYAQGKRVMGSARIFVETPRYSGPTPNGIDMVADRLRELVNILRGVSGPLETGEIVPPAELGRVAAGRTAEWVVRVLEADDDPEEYVLDVRKYVKSEKFTGWTRKGLRVSSEIVDDLVERLVRLADSTDATQSDWPPLPLLDQSSSADPAPEIPQAPQGHEELDSVPDQYKKYF